MYLLYRPTDVAIGYEDDGKVVARRGWVVENPRKESDEEEG